MHSLRINVLTRVLFLLAIAPAWACALSTTDAVYSLAQGCYAIQSPQTSRYLQTKTDADGSLRYAFDSTQASVATRFFLKPAQLGVFLLTDTGGNYLSHQGSAEEVASRKASNGAEWQINATQVSTGNFRYRLVNSATGEPISRVYWTGLFNLVPVNETYFNLRPATGCTPYPEIQLNVSSASGQANLSDALKGIAGQPVRGYIDAHTHLAANEFIGGLEVHGHPFHRWGVHEALDDCREMHGVNGREDILGFFAGQYLSHDTRGWPDFTGWPTNETLATHTGFYYRWVERAYLSGLRMLVVDLVENEELCKVHSLAKFALGHPGKSCDTLDSLRRQANDVKEMQDYIDAQAGGIGKGFFRMVYSPAEARRVIADGKLAVMLAIEASETFNCSDKNACDVNKISGRIDEYYNIGVRSMFMVHRFDTAFAGAHLGGVPKTTLAFVNIGNKLSNGEFFDAEPCDADTQGVEMQSGIVPISPQQIMPNFDSYPFLARQALAMGLDLYDATIGSVGPQYPSGDNNCNARGLDKLGAELVNLMIDKKMLIEVDHLGTSAAQSVLDIAEKRHYAGVVSSHSGLDPNRDSAIAHPNVSRVIRLGGYVSVINHNANELLEGKTSAALREMENVKARDPGYLIGLGIATDMNGMNKMVPERDDSATFPLSYPFTSEFGLSFQKQVSGNRTFDYNNEGIANYGMLADHIADIRQWSAVNDDGRIYESIMNSSEAYLRMWERAVNNTSPAHAYP